MRNYLFIPLLFLSTLGYGQDFKDMLSNDVCLCFETQSPSNYSQKSLLDCFAESLPKYEKDIDKLIDNDSELSEYEQGRVVGRQVFMDIQKDLIHNCNPYYDFMNGLREASITSLKEQSSQSMIDSLDGLIVKNPSVELLWERGSKHFAFQNLDKAEEDFRQCLKLNPNYLQADFFLAWVLEKKGAFSEVLKLYEKVYAVTKKEELVLPIEIVKRKIKEQ